MHIRLKPALLLFCLVFAIGAARAASWHVSPDGNDAHPGTRAQPWKTLERASRATLAPGDQLLLARGGSFTGTLKVGASGTERAPIVIGAYGKGLAPRLMNPYFAQSYGRIIEIGGSHVRVENLYLYDTPTPAPDEQPTRWQDSPQHKNVPNLAALFIDRDASHVTVSNNEFINAVVGVRVRGTHSVVMHNHFRDAAKITEQWGAIAIAIVGAYNEVSYNLVENYGFYGGAYVNDGAAVELDGEDPNYDAHHVHIHHNVSRNVKGGFLEIAGKSSDVLVEYNLSDDVDKFVGASNVRNIEIRHNTVLRTRLPVIPKEADFPLRTVFWTFNDKGDDEFHVTDNLFVLDGEQRVYQGPEHKLGFIPRTRRGNLYYTANGSLATMLGQPLGEDAQLWRADFMAPASGDYRLKGRARSAAGAFPPGAQPWTAGLTRPVAQ